MVQLHLVFICKISTKNSFVKTLLKIFPINRILLITSGGDRKNYL